MKRIAAIAVATLAISLSATAAHADPGSDDNRPVTGCGGGGERDGERGHGDGSDALHGDPRIGEEERTPV